MDPVPFSDCVFHGPAHNHATACFFDLRLAAEQSDREATTISPPPRHRVSKSIPRHLILCAHSSSLLIVHYRARRVTAAPSTAPPPARRTSHSAGDAIYHEIKSRHPVVPALARSHKSYLICHLPASLGSLASHHGIDSDTRFLHTSVLTVLCPLPLLPYRASIRLTNTIEARHSLVLPRIYNTHPRHCAAQSPSIDSPARTIHWHNSFKEPHQGSSSYVSTL